MAATKVLCQYVGEYPVGLWGFSQGEWAAPVAAASRPAGGVARPGFLVRSNSGATDAHRLRQAADAARIRRWRAGLACHPEGRVQEVPARRSGSGLDAGLRGCSRWSSLVPLSYVPPVLPDAGAWADMDFDPGPVFAGVSC